ncbi:MAG: DUF4832 domain-containing protein [bacterium]|nr:DUF4832 domain-containing protein [bacterium]
MKSQFVCSWMMIGMFCLFGGLDASARQWTVHPADSGEALVNPAMGWTLHYYSNIIENYGSKLEPSDTLDDFPGLAVIYLRLPWAFIEPREGEFHWSIVDAPAQRWIDKGLRVAFRFSCCESWMRYATPKWVEEAGAKGYNFSPGERRDDGPYWEPDYNDPVFLEKQDRFLDVAAARYDGNPNVDFIDVGSFGVWGEGHTFSSTRMKYPAEVVEKHIDLYLRHFKKTLLAVNDDFAFQGGAGEYDINKYPGLEIIEDAAQRGMTLRDDSIMVQPPPKSFFNAKMAQWFWPAQPVVLECQHYGPSRDSGAWGDGSMYIRAVEEYHASYASIHWWPREFLEEQRGLIDRINRRLGYRLQLRELTAPESASLTEPMTVSMKWANAGVAPCYPDGFIALTLKDDHGGICGVFVNEDVHVREFPVGPPDEAPEQEVALTCRFARNMKPGMYQVFVSVGMGDGTPVIALPHEGDDGHRRYFVGEISIQ